VIPALFAAFFFGVTPVIAGRGVALIGFVRQNVLRLLFAAILLGVWAFAFGQGLRGEALLFATAGAIGFGIGGMSLLAALPSLGAPLASLIEETLAAAIAAIVAFYWYADKLTTLQLEFCGVILLGVVIGLAPYVVKTTFKDVPRKTVFFGIGVAFLAALGQGISLAATRKGILLMKAAHTPPDVITISFQRMVGGLLVAVVVYLAARYVWKRKWGFSAADGTVKALMSSDAGKLTSRPLYWAGLNSLLGPILAVTFTVWAQQTLSAGVVQSIAAVAPLVAVPFAFWLQGHRPPKLWYVGAGVAIAGLIVLYMNS
jgi:drug/metabolite transporter (DMT)-like permease